MKYVIRDREAGNAIITTYSYTEALRLKKEYEEEDKRDGIFEENFYEIIEQKMKIYICKHCQAELTNRSMFGLLDQLELLQHISTRKANGLEKRLVFNPLKAYKEILKHYTIEDFDK